MRKRFLDSLRFRRTSSRSRRYLGPLEEELQARMARDGQLATSIVHMARALTVVREMLDRARSELARREEDRSATFRFDLL